jgi:protoheme IX farnesyltransferase
MLLQLFRLRLSAMVAASALAGYALYPGPRDPAGAAWVVVGIFLLAAGCSGLNQVQERATDALMARTRSRPIPSGRLTPRAALTLSLPVIGAGLAALALAPPPLVPALGAFSIFWYNGLYTPLKKITGAAALPGAVCGAIPPLIGWVAAGGEPSDYRIVVFAGILFLWQLPHFWLFALKFRDDFRRAGFPTLFPASAEIQIGRIILVWILSLAAGCLMLGALGLLQEIPTRIFCLGIVTWIVGCAVGELGKEGKAIFQGRIFARLNLFMAMMLASVILDGLLPYYSF